MVSRAKIKIKMDGKIFLNSLEKNVLLLPDPALSCCNAKLRRDSGLHIEIIF